MSLVTTYHPNQDFYENGRGSNSLENRHKLGLPRQRMNGHPTDRPPAPNWPSPTTLDFPKHSLSAAKISDHIFHLCHHPLSKALQHLGYTFLGLNNIGDLCYWGWQE